MTFYKEKIQKELKKTLQNFKNSQNRSSKTRHIQKEAKTKRVFRLKNSFHQKQNHPTMESESHVLNFYNFFSINEMSIRNPKHHESFVQSNFYYKIIKKIEIKENYIILFLNDAGLFPNSIQETLNRYKTDENEQLRSIGLMLHHLSQKMDLATNTQATDISLTAQTYQLLNSLGSTPFICKVFSEKLVISKSLLELQDYNSQQFIIQSLKYKLPLFECFSCQNYQKIIKKEIQFYSKLFDVLHGNLPFATFLKTTSTTFADTITSKNNVEYSCQISLSMPIPLIELIKVDKIVKKVQHQGEPPSKLIGQNVKKYQQKIWQKQSTTLQYLLPLPTNYLPQNKQKTATYQSNSPYLSPNIKTEEDDKLSSSSKSYSNNSHTFSVLMEQSKPNQASL